MSSVTFQSGSTFVRSQPSDSIVLAVVQRRRAEGRGSVAAKTLERSEHSVGHVIYEHPGADQNTPERHFTGPVCVVTDLGKTGSGKKGERGKKDNGKTLCGGSNFSSTCVASFHLALLHIWHLGGTICRYLYPSDII